jgi:hypothetical protein
MKISLTALILLGTSCAVAVAQKHAPTVEVCRADVALWYNTQLYTEFRLAQKDWFADQIPNRTDIAKLSLSEIGMRVREMGECWSVDNHEEKYLKAMDLYDTAFTGRYIRFVRRHHLEQQLMSEDEQGLR